MAEYGFTINVDGNAQARIKEISAALEKMGVETRVQVVNAERRFTELGASIKRSLGNLKTILLGGLAGGSVFAGFDFLRSSKEYFDATERSIADMRQTLRSMNDTTGLGEKGLLAMAESFNKVSVYSKPALLQAEAFLATFGNIKGTTFSETMQSVVDAAAKFFGGDLVLAAKQIGIAMNDPAVGAQRLRREGVTLSQQDIQRVKNLEKQGKLQEAQLILLKELKRESSGQAAAYAATDAGKIEMAKKAWEDMKNQIGEIISHVEQSLIPYFTKVLKISQDILKWLGENKDTILVITKIVVGGLAGWLAYKAVIEGIAIATEAWKNAQLLLDAALDANPIGLIVTGIGALTGAFVALGSSIEHAKKANDDLKESLSAYLGKSDDEIKSQIFDIADRYKYGIKGFDKHGMAIHYSVAEQNKLIAQDIEKQKSLFIESFGKGEKTTEQGYALKFGLKLFDQYKNVLRDRGKGSPNGGATGGGSDRQNAINTSDLAGAKGGLGEAKVINIHIDTVQKNIGVKESRDKSDQAAEQILRVVNNLGYSASSTQ